MAHQECLFCKIIEGKIPSQKIFENESVYAFSDIHPQAKHHFLVIPKIHVTSLAELSDTNIMASLYEAALQIAKEKGFKESGFRTVINTGQHGGQTVFHLHLHLLAGSQLSGKFN